jgi:acyl-CoA thioester hydrolase
VSGVRLGVEERAEARRVEVPEALGVAAERLDRRHLERVDLGPDARVRAEVRDAALGAHPRARQHDDGLPGADELGEPRDGVHAPIVGFGAVEGFRFSTDVTVRFAETDAQGIAHHASFLVWCEVARIAWLAEHTGGYNAIRAEGVEALTIEAHLRFLRPAFFDDRLRVWARAGDVRGARFRYEYAFEREGELVADGWTAHATVDASSHRPVRVPASFAEAVARVEATGPA